MPAEGPGSLLRDGNRVLVEVRFARGAVAGIDDLRGAGAEIVDVSRRFQVITIAAKPSELTRLSSIPRVVSVTEILAPIAAASTCPSGVAVSEGDVQLRAAEARSTFGVDGSGVEVGILSDSFDQDKAAETSATDDVKSGDLPGTFNTCTGQSTPVDVLEDFNDPEAADEGRAMAQIVHDLAPGASLSFATAFTGLTAFAGNIEDLAAAGADVIVDDVSYFEEPFFQEGPVGVAVSNVTAAGVSYFSSAANNNLISEGKDIASWEAQQYRDSSGCPESVVALSEFFEEEGESGLNPAHCMDFNPGPEVDRTFRLTVSKGATLVVDLQWAEPWNGVNTDLDAFLLGPEGLPIAASLDDNVFGTPRPFELLAWENETLGPAKVQLVINRYNGASPRLKFALLQNGGGVSSTEYQSSQGGDVMGPTIFGHNGAEDATSVGAIRYNATEAPEAFSSRGPVTHYFEPANGVSPAGPLASAKVISKPDVTATDCGATTFFASFVSAESTWRFCGTSAAAPHVAAVAALMLQEEPLASPDQIRAALWESATPIGSSGPCSVGAGLVNATGALEDLLAPESGTGPACTPPESGPVVEEGEDEGPNPAPQIVQMPPPESIPGPTAEELRSVPATFLRRHPSKVLRTEGPTTRALFRFGSDEAGVTFLCKFDRAVFRTCHRRTIWHVEPGRHVLRVKARDADGNVDPTPAVFRFRVERVG